MTHYAKVSGGRQQIAGTSTADQSTVRTNPEPRPHSQAERDFAREILGGAWKGPIPIDYNGIRVFDRGATTNDYSRINQSENLGIPDQTINKWHALCWS